MLNLEEQQILLTLARYSIQEGLKGITKLDIDMDRYPLSIRKNLASFVALEKKDQLRGCIGSLIAHQPLVLDVIQNAFSAAFRDPRFSPVTKDEFGQLDLHISVLSEPTAIAFDSEQDLLKKIQPGIDGLILKERGLKSTFLPSVWEELPDPSEFLKHLKAKAGLSTNYWSDTIQMDRYTAQLF